MTDNSPDRSSMVEASDDAIIGVAFRVSLIVILILSIGIVAAIVLRRTTPTSETIFQRGPIVAPERLVQDLSSVPAVVFTDTTLDSGIAFVHENGGRGLKLLPETMGPGCAFLDFDNDGDQDLLFVNGTNWPDDPETDSTLRLYANDGSGRFTDMTGLVGLDINLYGMGVAYADYDGDGDTDLFITSVGPNLLLSNDSGRFVDVTGDAGVTGRDADWSTSAGFFDYDNDGDLDLFVCNYVQWSRQIDIELHFTLNGTDRAYGPPNLYQGAHNTLYRNEGDGTFTDVSESAGIHITNPATGQPMGKALALTFVDIDSDGYLDVLVANDTVQNFLLQNNRDGTFTEVGAQAGVAYDGMGSATGAMGIDAADFANTGRFAIGIGNFANEATSFYVQQAQDPWQFSDMSSSEGIGSPSRLKLSFGLFFFDYDLDGRLDILQANGHLEDKINEVQPSQHFRQPAQLFWNSGSKARSRFVAVDDTLVGDLAKAIVGRGAAYADIDGDGDLDIALTENAGPAFLLRNDQQTDHKWLRVRLIGAAPNVNAIGAWVELTSQGVTQKRQVMPTRSYLSQVELPVTFGLGESDTVDALEVRWPNGSRQRVDVKSVNQTITVKEHGF